MAHLVRKGPRSIAPRSFPRRLIMGLCGFHAVRVILGRAGFGCRALVNSLRGVGLIGSAGRLLGTRYWVSWRYDSGSRVYEVFGVTGLDLLFKVLASVPSPCTSFPFAQLNPKPWYLAVLVSLSVSRFSCVFSISRLMLLRAGVPRGVLSVELVSWELASVVFSFWLLVLEITASVFAKKSARRLIHTHRYLWGAALQWICYFKWRWCGAGRCYD